MSTTRRSATKHHTEWIRSLRTPRARLAIGLFGIIAAVAVAPSLGTWAAADPKPAQAAASPTPGHLTVDARLGYHPGKRLRVLPYVHYRIAQSRLETLGARKPRLRARFRLTLAPKLRRGSGQRMIRVVRRSGFVPLVPSTSRRTNPQVEIDFKEIRVTRRKIARLRRLAARGRVVVRAGVLTRLRFKDASGERVVLPGPRRKIRRVFTAKAATSDTSGTGMNAVENRLTGTLVFDNSAGKFAGPINNISRHADNGSLFFTGDESFGDDEAFFFAWASAVETSNSITHPYPEGQVIQSAGNLGWPALMVTESYNEHDSDTPRMSCRVQPAPGSGLNPTCAMNRASWPGDQEPPEYDGWLLGPVAVDTWFVSAAGICQFADVQCWEPPSSPQTVASFEPNTEVFSMTGIFVYDSLAHQFAGPISRTGSSSTAGTLELSDFEGNVDKWHAYRPSRGELPQGWVEVAVGGGANVLPLLKIKAYYNENNQSQPRVRCELDAADDWKYAPYAKCLPYRKTTKLYEQTPSYSTSLSPKSNYSYFVEAPGICAESGVECADTPPLYTLPPPAPTTTKAQCWSSATSNTGGCKVTVSNEDASIPWDTPTGTVSFAPTTGSFTPGSCTLAGAEGSASCETDYSYGSWPIPPNTFVKVTVKYSGDDHHAASEDTATLGFNPQ